MSLKNDPTTLFLGLKSLSHGAESQREVLTVIWAYNNGIQLENIISFNGTNLIPMDKPASSFRLTDFFRRNKNILSGRLHESLQLVQS